MPDAPALPEGGIVHPIVRWGDPVMHRVQRNVTDFGEPLVRLVADMAATMYAADGVGLAACQVGVDLALFVYDCPDEDGIEHRGVVCNPVLRVGSGRGVRLDRGEEGCLSLPGAFVANPRPDWAEVTGLDMTGRPVRVTGTGLLARCLQHEADHCNGVVFADHLHRRAKRRLFREAEDAAARYAPTWPTDRSPQSRRVAT